MFNAHFDNFYLLIRRGEMEKSSVTRGLPVPKAVYSFLRDNVSSSFHFPGWNKGRVVCQRSQLKKLQLSVSDSSTDASEATDLVPIMNAGFPQPGTRIHTAEFNSDSESGTDDESLSSEKEAELLPIWMHRWLGNPACAANPVDIETILSVAGAERTLTELEVCKLSKF